MRILKRILVGVVAVVAALWLAMTVYAYWPQPDEIPVAKLATADDRFVTVDGLSLRYRRWGDWDSAGAATKPTLLLIHGFGNSLQSFRLLAPELADCCRVIAIDMPGYGLSAKPVEHDYHNGPQGRMMVDAARALGLEHVIYVGHSLGGAVALQAVVQDPDARGLVLLNPGIISTGVPKIVQLTVPPLPRLSARLFGSRKFRADFLQKSYVNPAIITPAVIDDVMQGARSEGYMTGMTSLMKQYSEGEEIRLAPRVQVPVLIPWGNQDRNKPRSEADELQKLLPGSTLVRFDAAGHYVHEEQPAAVAEAIRGWLAALPALPPTPVPPPANIDTPAVAATGTMP